jgi:hypothetical protein
MTFQNSENGGCKVHKHMRTHGSDGAIESGRDGPGLVGPSRPAWPTPGVGSAPLFLAPEGSSTLSLWRHLHSQNRESFAPRGHPQARESGGRSSEMDRSSRRKHPQVEKMEDTIGSVTMINGAISCSLMV